VAVGDYDNDGYPDIYVTNFGKNILYHNNGNGTFTDVTAKAGVGAGGWSVSAGFFDYDNDGTSIFLSPATSIGALQTAKTCGNENAMYCPPTEFPAISNILYHNRGDGTFEDVQRRFRHRIEKRPRPGRRFADYDGDGFTDILWRMTSPSVVFSITMGTARLRKSVLIQARLDE